MPKLKEIFRKKSFQQKNKQVDDESKKEMQEQIARETAMEDIEQDDVKVRKRFKTQKRRKLNGDFF